MAVKRIGVIAASAGMVALLAVWAWPRADAPNPSAPISAAAMVDVALPADFTGPQAAGAALFAQNCAACHGKDGAGAAGIGPPLVHIIYETSHHPDGAFYAAVQLGVRAHHWDYSDMPRQPHLSEAQTTQIIDYIRAVQRENGIF